VLSRSGAGEDPRFGLGRFDEGLDGGLDGRDALQVGRGDHADGPARGRVDRQGDLLVKSVRRARRLLRSRALRSLDSVQSGSGDNVAWRGCETTHHKDRAEGRE